MSAGPTLSVQVIAQRCARNTILAERFREGDHEYNAKYIEEAILEAATPLVNFLRLYLHAQETGIPTTEPMNKAVGELLKKWGAS